MRGLAQGIATRGALALGVSGVLGLAACGGGGGGASQAATTPVAVEPAASPPVKQSPPVAAPPPPAPKPRVFAKLAAGNAKAPWLATALAKRPEDPFGLRNVVALGKRIAVARTRDGYYVMTLRRGLVGPMVLPPGGRVVGVDGRDAIVAADNDGVIYRAVSPVAGSKAGGFKRVGKGPAAADANASVSYDVAGRWVIAVTGGSLWLSRNRGKTFRLFKTKKRDAVERALVRADGAMVLRIRNASDPAAKTYVSRRGGRATLATFQAKGLVRIGQWIMDSDGGDCTAVLARGGRRWVLEKKAPWKIANNRLNRWRGSFGHGVLPEHPLDPTKTLATAVSPRVPRFSRARAVTGLSKKCPGSGGGYGTGSGTGMADIAGLPVAPTRHELHLTHDAVAKSHGPRVVLTDAAAAAGKRVELAALPKDCDPVFATSIRGLGLLGCRFGDKGAKMRIVERRADGTWSDGYELAQGYDARPGTGSTGYRPRRAFSVAADGTIGMIPHCTSTCGIYVRAPVAAGRAGAWKRIAVPNALAYRVAPRGRAVAMVSTADFKAISIPAAGRAPVAVQFVLSDGASSEQLAEIKVGVRISAFAIAHQQIGLMLMRGRRYAPFLITVGGELIRAQ